MSTFVFVGPTLPTEAVAEVLDATCLPPVAQGDVISLLRRDPDTIVIVDGYFERVPAVWHKEILLALHAGVRVVGAASMGALRAAELDVFGMEGVGEIYRSFADGRLEDDDEVAVRHATAEHGYRAMSEALVNIRATLGLAEAEGVIEAALREQLIGLARAMPYPERSYPGLWAAARDALVSEEALAAVARFASERRIDQKRLDALAALRHVLEVPRPAAPSFTPAYTYTVDRLLDTDLVLRHEDGLAVTPGQVIEHARERHPGFSDLRAGAASTLVAVTLARAMGLTVSEAELQQGVDSFRAVRGLHSAAATAAWMAEHDLVYEDLVSLVEEDLLAAKGAAVAGEPSNRALLREAVRRGQWPGLRAAWVATRR